MTTEADSGRLGMSCTILSYCCNSPNCRADGGCKINDGKMRAAGCEIRPCRWLFRPIESIGRYDIGSNAIILWMAGYCIQIMLIPGFLVRHEKRPKRYQNEWDKIIKNILLLGK